MYNAIIVRHRKENLKKCSLRGLELRADLLFLTYPACLNYSKEENLQSTLKRCLILGFEGPELSLKDSTSPLLLLDGTWHYADKMRKMLTLPICHLSRSLPKELKTAYPRKQHLCEKPEQGLASVEALFAAFFILKKPCEDLLKNYFWKDEFLQKNSRFFSSH